MVRENTCHSDIQTQGKDVSTVEEKRGRSRDRGMDVFRSFNFYENYASKMYRLWNSTTSFGVNTNWVPVPCLPTFLGSPPPRCLFWCLFAYLPSTLFYYFLLCKFWLLLMHFWHERQWFSIHKPASQSPFFKMLTYYLKHYSRCHVRWFNCY